MSQKKSRTPESMLPPIFSEIIQNNPVILNLTWILITVFHCEALQSAQNLIALTFSYLVLNDCPSVRFSYNHCLNGISDKSLTSYYGLLAYSKINPTGWIDAIINIAKKLIHTILDKKFVFLSVDDTIVEKFGKKFEYIARLFDHSEKGQDKFKNAHCFVALILSFSVIIGDFHIFISIPIGIKMWTQNGPSKLEIAAEMIKHAAQVLGDEILKVVLCDSWYPKKEVSQLVGIVPNLSMVCNVRKDTAIYDLPVKKNGRGRPAKFGTKISTDDIKLMSIPGVRFRVGCKLVKTNLFGGDRTVLAIVTELPSEKSGEKASRRLFISTNPELLQSFDPSFLHGEAKLIYAANPTLLPLCIYKNRWTIEVFFQEMKTFWNFTGYRLLKGQGIERMLNLQMVLYAIVEMLPHLNPVFSELTPLSHQERRYHLGETIRTLKFLGQLQTQGLLKGNSEDLSALFKVMEGGSSPRNSKKVL